MRYVPNVGNVVAELFYFRFDVVCRDGEMHVLQDDPVGAVFLRFVSVELCVFGRESFSY
jgi:hypothetical protein